MILRKLLIPIASLSLPVISSATTLVLDTSINGVDPGSPYISATLTQIATNTVRVSMNNNYSSSDFVSTWLFNVDRSVSFAQVSGVAAQSATYLQDGYTGGNSVKAGYFDVQFSFATSNSGGGRLSAGTSSVYDLTGTGLTVSSFLIGSSPVGAIRAGGSQTSGWLSAADIQGIPAGAGTTSGSIGTKTFANPVPEPTTMTAFAIAGLVGLRRRKKQ